MNNASNRQFTSDNRGGIVPEVWAALQEANAGHAASYGQDPWTKKAADALRDLFECNCDVYFVTTGTAANGLTLAAMCESYQAVVCHEYAHVETDECGAPEFFSNGSKLLLAGGENGRLTPDAVREVVRKRTDVHYPRPRVLSVSQATELGTVYTPAELKALCESAKADGLRVHMDGARFFNAMATLGCTPADLTWKSGIDALCLGGTKVGMLGSEAVLFFDRDLGFDFERRCKQAGQLLSKMRFPAAQWIGMLENHTALRYASHANAMATRLQAVLAATPGISVLFPTQANSVFANFEGDGLERLRGRGWDIYSFIGVGGARFMCAWDTDPADIDRLKADLADLFGTRR